MVVIGARDWNDRAAIKQHLQDVGATLVAHRDLQGCDWITDAVAASEGIACVRFLPNRQAEGVDAEINALYRMLYVIEPDLVIAFTTRADRLQAPIALAEQFGCAVLTV